MNPVVSIRRCLHRVWGPNLHIGYFDGQEASLRQATWRATDQIVGLLRPQRGARVLDVGCGFALAVEGLAAEHGCVAVGLDSELWRLQRARRLHATPVPLVAGDGTRLPFADRTFDLCVALESLSYVDDVGAATRELLRVLRPGGRLGLLDYFSRDHSDHPEAIFPNDAARLLTRVEWRALFGSGATRLTEADWSAHGLETYRRLQRILEQDATDPCARQAARNMADRVNALRSGAVGNVVFVFEKR